MLIAVLPILYMLLGAIFLFAGIVVGALLEDKKMTRYLERNGVKSDGDKPFAQQTITASTPNVNNMLVEKAESILLKPKPKSQVMHYKTPQQLQKETDDQAMSDFMETIQEKRGSGSGKLPW